MNPEDQMAGGTPQMPTPPGGGLSPDAPMTDEQRKELAALIAKVQEKAATLGSSNFVIKNETEQRRRDALKEIFMRMAAEGVDLSDPASVSQFTMKLQTTNPDLYELFVEAIDKLMNDTQQNDQEEEPLQPPVPGVS